jgi:hypothetical protein
MRLSERRKEGTFYFAVQHTAGSVVGGEVEIAVFTPRDGDGVLLLPRTLYFDEQSHEHIDKFCKEFAYDEQYRKICLDSTAHWCRVARLYEVNARIMQDEQTIAPDALKTRGRELFHFIRRDLAAIEGSSEYRKEMARISRGGEDDLDETLTLLAKVKKLKVASACQGSFRLQVMEGRDLYLPSCHSARATITMGFFPQSLKNYLHSGPLRQQHLARFEENRISAVAVSHNKRFIQILTASLYGFLQKQGHRGSR